MSQSKLQALSETEQSNDINSEIQNEYQKNQHKSNRRSLLYCSSDAERKYIICNESKYKRELLQLCNISLKSAI